jgi:hypothetical protein
MGASCADHAISHYSETLALTSLTSGGHPVGTVRLRTRAKKIVLFVERLHEANKSNRSVRRLLVKANVPSSMNMFTLMIVALRSSETSVITRRIRLNIPEDGILHSNRPGNLTSYIALTGWAL